MTRHDYRMHGWSLDDRMTPYVVIVGLHGVSLLGNMKINHFLVTMLVERWRQETHTFLPICKAAVILQDVVVLLGLRLTIILQGSVIFPDKSKDDFPLFVLPLLQDLEEADTFSWGSKCAYTMSYVVQLATKLAPPYPPTNTCIASLTIIYLL